MCACVLGPGEQESFRTEANDMKGYEIREGVPHVSSPEHIQVPMLVSRGMRCREGNPSTIKQWRSWRLMTRAGLTKASRLPSCKGGRGWELRKEETSIKRRLSALNNASSAEKAD